MSKGKATIHTERIAASRCPGCRTLLDAVTGAAFKDDAEEFPPRPLPKPGKYSLCATCGMLLKFGEHLELCAATDAEREQAFAGDEILREMYYWIAAQVSVAKRKCN
jgi:hypothetical protein